MGKVVCLCLLVLLLPCLEVQARPMLLAHTISGGRFYYVVNDGDTFASLGSRYGVDPVILAAANRRSVRSRLKVGDGLWIDNRHIVPADIDDGLLINVPQRMLFVLSNGRLTAAYPVSVGKPGWRTPRGSFTVIEKRSNPTWRVPPSIQAEMAAQGKRVRTRVPPGPDNPLGRHWVGLSLSAIGCHGTIAPLSIYHFRTHGCIRLHPDDAADLFSRTELGTPGEIIYSPVLIAQLADGRIFVEANPDAYGLGSDTAQDIQALAEIRGLSHMINWPKVREALERRDGLAREVSIWRTCWWDALPMEWWGIALGPGLGEASIADSCSRSEP
jgi:L,D-transpeptidase ErfK/SrfK